MVRILFWAILVPSIALSAILLVAIVLAAISADTIVPLAIFAEVTELSATADAVPVKLPSIFATRVPVVIDKSPVDAPVNVPVPTINLSVQLFI